MGGGGVDLRLCVNNHMNGGKIKFECVCEFEEKKSLMWKIFWRGFNPAI